MVGEFTDINRRMEKTGTNYFNWWGRQIQILHMLFLSLDFLNGIN